MPAGEAILGDYKKSFPLFGAFSLQNPGKVGMKSEATFSA